MMYQIGYVRRKKKTNILCKFLFFFLLSFFSLEQFFLRFQHRIIQRVPLVDVDNFVVKLSCSAICTKDICPFCNEQTFSSLEDRTFRGLKCQGGSWYRHFSASSVTLSQIHRAAVRILCNEQTLFGKYWSTVFYSLISTGLVLARRNK